MDQKEKFEYEKPSLQEFNPLLAVAAGASCAIAPATVPDPCVGGNPT